MHTKSHVLLIVSVLTVELQG